MHNDRIAYFTGAYINITEKQTNSEGIEKLKEVHVKKTEAKSRKKHGCKFTVLFCAVNNGLPENKLFKNRGKNGCSDYYNRVDSAQKTCQIILRLSV